MYLFQNKMIFGENDQYKIQFIEEVCKINNIIKVKQKKSVLPTLFSHFLNKIMLLPEIKLVENMLGKHTNHVI